MLEVTIVGGCRFENIESSTTKIGGKHGVT